MAKIVISKTKIKNGDFAELAKMAYAINPQSFKDTFKKVGIEVQDAEDVEALVIARKTDMDVEGKLKSPMGYGVKFNALWVLKSIPVNNNDVLLNVVFEE